MPSSILGALLFDRKPKVPQYPQVDIEKEQAAAIAGNRASLPGLEALGADINKYTADQLDAMLERAMPGYKGLIAKGTENIGSFLRGQIPEDVARVIGRSAAEQGIATGTSGSELARKGLVENLGLTSLDLTSRGLNSTLAWMADAERRSPVFDFTSMFITPQQRIAVKLQENQMIFQRNWLANKIKAMPEGWESAVKGLLDWISNTGASVVSMGIGGAMGGGAGGGMMGGGGGGGSTPSYSQQFSTLNTAAPTASAPPPSSSGYAPANWSNPTPVTPAYQPGNANPPGTSDYFKFGGA
jgi:hypothetical protein